MLLADTQHSTTAPLSSQLARLAWQTPMPL
jgi:hypothetical protein